jgi:hypothetical protein
MAAENAGRFFDHIAPVNFDMVWITAAHAHLLHGRSDCVSPERSKAFEPAFERSFPVRCSLFETPEPGLDFRNTDKPPLSNLERRQ